MVDNVPHRQINHTRRHAARRTNLYDRLPKKLPTNSFEEAKMINPWGLENTIPETVYLF